jgi:hypothetical protein
MLVDQQPGRAGWRAGPARHRSAASATAAPDRPAVEIVVPVYNEERDLAPSVRRLHHYRPVMAIGGFNGSDPAPTLAQFQQYVAAGRIHYFIAGAGAGVPGAGGSGTAGQMTSWVRQHFTAETVGGTTVYDLTAPASATSG